MGLDLGKIGLSKLGKGMGLWNFVWSIEEREREVPKNLRDMGGRMGMAVQCYPNQFNLQGFWF